MKYKKILGIDIGGSGIKGAIVNTKKGTLKSKRYRIITPVPATPESVGKVIKKIVKHFDWKGPIGVGYPGVVQNGVARTAANVDPSWIDTDINGLFSELTGCPVQVVNDADSAGYAEMKFGAGAGFKGVAALITVGTGLGTVMFTGGKLMPNLELGHIILHGDDAEKYASDAARKNDDLSWEDWGRRFSEYLGRLEDLTWPDLIIIGGGASKKDDRFFSYLKTRAKVVPAELLNEAGIIGAAIAAKAYHKAQQSAEKKKK
ncbi:MAG TPA: ROK family protein [Bacteroidales bacterium]|nr:ROK family protein [Bacteroidales bacterium]